MKRVISLILSAALLIMLVSCGEKNRSYDEAEVKAAAESLILKSEQINDICWGSGIPYYDDDNYANGQYYPADPVYLNKLGVSTVDEILELVVSIFSEGYSASIYGSTFSSMTGENGMVGYTRYYQGIDCIMVYTKYKPILCDDVEYITSDIEVIGSKGEVVTVRLPIKVTRDGTTQEKTIDVSLIEEENGWRIDSPTYAVFTGE